MNGAPLNELHGAPLRLRNELELGFKQVIPEGAGPVKTAVPGGL
jgi:hypothetical protein